MKPPRLPDTPPIVVLGMHRSGTSMISAVLSELGVNMGVHTEHNRESVFFLQLNEWLLMQAGASWFTPGAFSAAVDSPEFMRIATTSLARAVSSPFAYEHHGARPFSPWGFKDPRTTITWPVWRLVYPQARLVILRRHGVDVARSLSVRAHRAFADPPRLWTLGLRLPMMRSDIRVAWAANDVNRGLELWAQYCELEDAAARQDEPAVKLEYGEVLAQPSETVDALVEHLELDPSPSQRLSAASVIGTARPPAPPPDALDGGRALQLLRRHGYDLHS